jgi:hypothetical protein
MNLEASIAHAIHSNLDIIQAAPEVVHLSVDELEPYIEEFVTAVHQSMYSLIQTHGEPFIRAKDSAGLCATLQQFNVQLPNTMLLRMCQTIMDLSSIEATFILDTDEGACLYYAKMDIDVGDLIAA